MIIENENAVLWGNSAGPNPHRFVAMLGSMEQRHHIGDSLTLDHVVHFERERMPQGVAIKNQVGDIYDVTIFKNDRRVATLVGNLDGPPTIERHDDPVASI